MHAARTLRGMDPESMALAELLPQPPRKPRIWMWAVPLAVVLLGGVAAGTYLATRPAAAPKARAASAATSTAPTASSHLDERAACQALVPAVQDGVTAMKNLIAHSDGSTVDQQSLDATISTLADVEGRGPADLVGKISDTLEPLRGLQSALAGGGNRQIDTAAFTFAGQGIIDQCQAYA